MKKTKFNVQGMTCSSCKAHVEKAVNNLDGVQSVNVNLLSNNMIVEYNESILDNDKVIDAVNSAGYSASIENSKNNNYYNNYSNYNMWDILCFKQKIFQKEKSSRR